MILIVIKTRVNYDWCFLLLKFLSGNVSIIWINYELVTKSIRLKILPDWLKLMQHLTPKPRTSIFCKNESMTPYMLVYLGYYKRRHLRSHCKNFFLDLRQHCYNCNIWDIFMKIIELRILHVSFNCLFLVS